MAADPYTPDQNPAATRPVVTTSAERAGFDQSEPRLTLSQLQGLLREAAAYERAQRPIVLHSPENHPAAASQTSPATYPAGIDAHYHAPAPTTVTTAVRSERSIWPLVFMASACTGIGACLVSAVTGSLIPVAVTLAAFAVWAVATYQIVFVREP